MKSNASSALTRRPGTRGWHSRSSSALLITLLTLTLMTIIVVAFLGTMNWEVQASRRNFEAQKARAIAMLGMNTAVAQLRTALGKWDSPYGYVNDQSTTPIPGFQTNPPTSYWSVSPGILTMWSYTSTNAITNYPLFSVPTNAATASIANLNAPAEDGTYPILGSPTPLPVYWVNVLTYPTVATPNATNQIIGRYAFWMDDENSKININTADGTFNTNLPPQQCGLGFGTPTAVSLQELQSGSGVGLSMTGASNIVAIARTVGFNSPREILRATDPNGTITPGLYTNNIFNLTMMSRSPDFNVFGQPKMPLITASYTNAPYLNAGNFLWNLTTLQPLRELFPSQNPGSISTYTGVLPTISLTNKYSNISPATGASVSATYNPVKWPLAFMTVNATGNGLANPGPGGGNGLSAGDNMVWDNGQVIADYLSGLNANGRAITWPAFPEPSGGTYTNSSYLGKYTARQIDSITMQILDLASKDISPDMGRSDGTLVRTAPMYFRGWLSGQLVSGAGRSPKLDKVLMAFNTYAGTSGATNVPPQINAQVYLEQWFPSRFQGVSLFHRDVVYGAYQVGNQSQPGYVNSQDMSGEYSIQTNGAPVATLYNTNWPAPLPKLGSGIIAGYPGNTNSAGPPDGTAGWNSYWGNDLLRTDQGVDWGGNPNSLPDPDQYLAEIYHQNAPTNSTGQYMGEGPVGTTNWPAFKIPGMVKSDNSGAGTNEWAPGEYRCVSNFNAASANEDMSTNAAGKTIHISGGLQFMAQMLPGRGSEPDVVPLDAMRGSGWNAGFYASLLSSNTPIWDRTTEPFVGNPTTFTPYTNVINAVVPITIGMSVYANNAYPPSPSTGWVYDYVRDPLVNKYPGDWIMATNSGSPPAAVNSMGMQYLNTSTPHFDANGTTTNSWYAAYGESAATQTSFLLPGGLTPTSTNNYTDPDAYWLPTIDNNATLGVDGVPTFDEPQIPRSSRFPSSGYLQYLRTGIIPDDETQVLALQHGTPFRLLNFNASTDPSQVIGHSGYSGAYPDWAMLNLFYVPSSLLSYGSPYETYAGAVYTQAALIQNLTNTINYPVTVTYTNTNVVNNMYLYGTYGGATSGRINPNGAVVYTTNVSIPTPGISRTVPLQALFRGLMVNQTQTGNYTNTFTTNDFHGPILTTPTPVNETNLANAVTNYLTGNGLSAGYHTGPFRMAEEICNVPEIAALYANSTPDYNPTRNDLVRQVIGNLTTQSNTFSIWVEAESIIKSKGNVNYGVYENGDQITGTVRYHYIVERDLNPGTDGVYGNASPGSSGSVPYAGPDGVVGTLDDVMQATANPANPNYVYRIIYAEEIR